MLRELNAETIHLIDEGSAALIIDDALRKAAFDTDDRGKDGKPREVQIVISMTLRENGQVDLFVKAAAKLPPRRTPETVCNLKMVGKGQAALAFQEFDATDPNQRTIDEATDTNERT